MITRIRRSWLIWAILLGTVFLLFEIITSPPSSTSNNIGPTPPTPWHQRFNPATFLPGNYKKPAHPADYLVQPKEDDYCEQMYGPSYLQHLADTHTPYCEKGSKSDMECFVTHQHDPICVARGVSFRPQPGDGHKKWAMDCHFRNFTTEATASPQKANELAKFQNVEDIHEYFYWTGVRMQLEQWSIGTGASTPPDLALVGKDGHGHGNCDKSHNDGKITLLVKREMNHNVWHKLMELWQAMLTLDALEMTTWHPSGGVPAIGQQPFLTPETRKNVQVVFEDNDVGPVDELWPLLTGSQPVRADSLNTSCLGTVILPLAGSASPFWDSHWTDRDCHSKFMLDPFLARIYRTLGIAPHNRITESTVVTIVDRRHGTRQIYNLASHVSHLRQVFPKVQFNVVDFATLSLKQQIETARNTDVLVGVMGAGMTHILWLPDESTVAELMTPGTHYSGFRNLCGMRGIDYFTAHGVPEEEWVKTHPDGGEAQNQQKQSQELNAGGYQAPKEVEVHKDWREQEKKSDDAAAPAAKVGKRHWQEDKFLYFTEKMFTSLVAAAINAQLNRGLRSEDVVPVV